MYVNRKKLPAARRLGSRRFVLVSPIALAPFCSRSIFGDRPPGQTAMTQNVPASSDHLWLSIRREAEAALVGDPVFGASLSAAILDHRDFGSAVSHQIGERLGRSAADRRQFARIAREAFLASPDLVDAASRDLQSIAVHDPATTALLPPLLNFQ